MTMRDDRARTRLLSFLNKCATWRPTRALIIDRDPLDAIWSEYQRQRASGGGSSWASSAPALDCGHSTTLRSLDRAAWARAALNLARSYAQAWASHGAFAARFGDDAVHVVSYEDLKASPRSCEATLRGALQWLDAPAPAARGDDDWAGAARAACGAKLGGHSLQRATVASSAAVAASDAWHSQALVCRVLRTIYHDVTKQPWLGLGAAPRAGRASTTRLARLLLSRVNGSRWWSECRADRTRGSSRSALPS